MRRVLQAPVVDSADFADGGGRGIGVDKLPAIRMALKNSEVVLGTRKTDCATTWAVYHRVRNRVW